ncbi:MAG: ferric reductase-like transmembrane domain-containing protein [Acetobacteraceae bacterium]|nr:ferric reductase-like transmembrane domain-containing protein [Acetobacteraceae bacterium]
MWNSIAGLWQDRAGRFERLKAAALVMAVFPALLLGVRAVIGGLGSRPITEATLNTGDWVIRFFLLSLAVTPGRALLDAPKLVPLRRIFGVAAACYAVLHVLIYAYDQKWNLGTIVTEILQRFYLTIGFVAVLGLVVLAITSTDGWQRTLRHRWKQLHRLIWPIGVLALLHYFLQSKINVAGAVFDTGLFLFLLIWRQTPRRWQTSIPAMVPLILLVWIGTALVEFAWYALGTKLDPWRVLRANLDILYTVRPAEEILIAGAAMLLVVLVRRWWKQRLARA